MAHLVIESLVMAYFPLTRVLISRVSYGICHSKGTDKKFHSRLKSERFERFFVFLSRDHIENHAKIYILSRYRNSVSNFLNLLSINHQF